MFTAVIATSTPPAESSLIENALSFLLGAVLAAIIAYWNQRHGAAINRARLTSEFINSWDCTIGDVREKLEKQYGDHYGPQATVEDIDDFKTSASADWVKELYNRLDYFAALYCQQYYDTAIIDALMKRPIIAIYWKYHRLQRYLEQNDRRWPVLDSLIKDWCDNQEPSRLLKNSLIVDAHSRGCCEQLAAE